jgi:hypothetical protein
VRLNATRRYLASDAEMTLHGDDKGVAMVDGGPGGSLAVMVWWHLWCPLRTSAGLSKRGGVTWGIGVPSCLLTHHALGPAGGCFAWPKMLRLMMMGRNTAKGDISGLG